MNKTKRNLELAGAIVSICVSSFMCFSFIILLLSEQMLIDSINAQVKPGYYIPQEELNELINVMRVTSIILLLVSIANIICSSLLCSSPIKNKVIRSRLGLKIAVLVLNGLFLVFSIENFLTVILYATPFGLILSSLFLKNNSHVVEELAAPTKMPEVETVVIENSKVENANIVDNNEDIVSVEKQLLKLKELKDMEVLDEEQYRSAVDKLINKL